LNLIEYSHESAKQLLDVNYRGTLQVCKEFIPIMKKAGRIVNVSSEASDLQHYSKEIQSRFRSAATTLDGHA
jgi:carbonyl reductase 1